jgi:hypothetical protein
MSLAALASCCPTWADFRLIHAFEAQVDVVATRSSGSFTRVFELRVVQDTEQVAVFERPVGRTLPACCPERHINPDGSFCIGLRAGEGITEKNASPWWEKLHVFILCQETAAETGFCPARRSYLTVKPAKLNSLRSELPTISGSSLSTAKRSRSGPAPSRPVSPRSTRRPDCCVTDGVLVFADVPIGISEFSFEGSVIAVAWAVLSCSSIGGASRSTNIGAAFAAKPAVVPCENAR